MRAGNIALIVGSAVAVAATMTWAFVHTHQHRVVPCADVEVVSARGTDQPPGVGNNGEVLIDSLRSKLPGRSVEAYAVNYPASKEMVSSVRAGVDDARTYVQSTVADCPRTRMVLTGYSQGAAVIDEVTEELPGGFADHVSAVAVFGNPTSSLAKRLAGGKLPAISPLYRAKTIELCIPRDPICTDGDDWTAHASYVTSGLAEKAAAFVAQKL